MCRRFLLSCFIFLTVWNAASQGLRFQGGEAWADSVLASLGTDEKIAQLLVLRLSSINLNTREVTFYEREVEAAVKQYNIGGICLFQGGPVRQAKLVNYLQSIAKTPLLISIDGENGLGMRIDSIVPLPRQMMLGAVGDPELIYRYGRWVGRQCRRMGIQVNFAPVADINNNPDNPVINDRSFGENKVKVTDFAIRYMKGLQDEGVMACAKHFPGHGDVSVDSHYDLPVINKSKAMMDTLEWYPFRELFRAGIGSAMVGHLFIPALDPTPNRATSLSAPAVSGLLKHEMGFDGLVFTDALEMKGVSASFPDGTAAVEALTAGNDLLCLPGEVSIVMSKIKDAIRNNQIKQTAIDSHLRRILLAKYRLGLATRPDIPLGRLADDLNSESRQIRQLVAREAITLVKYQNKAGFPLPPEQNNRIALVSIGRSQDNAFASRLRKDYNADVFYFDYKRPASDILSVAELIRSRYDAVVIGVHGLSRFPAGNFGLSEASVELVRTLDAMLPVSVFVFGNAYAMRNFPQTRNLIACYEDDEDTQDVAADILNGRGIAKGTLPVTVTPELTSGIGLRIDPLPVAGNSSGSGTGDLFATVDSIAEAAIRARAIPGCVVLAAGRGRILYHRSFGYYTYDSTEAVRPESVFDMASVTKICATTLSVMKLYDRGQLSLSDRLGDFLPWVRGSDKESLRIRDILLHQAGLKAWIPFFRETIDTITGIPFAGYYSRQADSLHTIPVADTMFMKTSWRDTLYKRIVQSPLEKKGVYVYSDNDFIFLGKIVEAISGMPLDSFVQKEFYRPMGLTSTGFNPRSRITGERLVPTEQEKIFRRQLIRGYVHDPGAAMFGGVSGHAGLFSQALDIAAIMHMLMNGGLYNGKRFLSDSTVRLFTAYGSPVSRRGLGFDKPEKDNATRKEPYPSASASYLTFGHTGFTGTCAWADPKTGLVFVFLSNRVYPDAGTAFLRMNVRGNVQEAFYQVLRKVRAGW